VKLTIFRRITLVQGTLFALVVLVSVFAISHLDGITQLNTNILTVDTVCVQEGKRLIKIFLGQMRNAEKYLILRDQELYINFIRDKADVLAALEKIEALVDTPLELELIEQIRYQQDRYEQGIHSAGDDMDAWKETRTEISDEIINNANELIHIRERIIEDKTTNARDEALSASRMVAWFASGGMILAFLLAYIQARSISNPLNKLAREMRRLARGERVRRLHFRSPPEIRELADTFHWMAEELAQLDQMKADFTAHVSHELRTPLTGIREGTSLLLEEIPGPITPSQAEILGVVQSHSERLFSTISSILDLSKMEEEMMEYEMTAGDLSTLIQKSIANVTLIAQKKRTKLTSIIPEPLPLVLMDERRIQQVLDNLLSNALKFNGEGGEILIVARSLPCSPGGVKEIEVRVRDNGVGIPESDLENVFTKFFQSYQDRRQKYRGTGLGLAIARHIIHAHKGRIWVESQMGRGSIFTFTLPLDPIAETENVV
jgi:two-component system, NtrC family, sensor histidine kinase GlrK